MVHYIELQHAAVELLEAAPERDETHSTKMVCLPRPDLERFLATLSHHDAAVLASPLADDLARATWEDAEWR